MTDDQVSKFEEQARRVGRKSLPREWRTEILEAAWRDDEDRSLAPEQQAIPFKAIKRPDAQDEGALQDPASDRETLEGRIRKAERRALWSMAACFVVTLFVIALLFRPRPEARTAQSRFEEDSARTVSSSDRERGEKTVSWNRGELMGSNQALAAVPPQPALLPPVPPPPAPPGGEAAPVGPGEDVAQVEEANGGFLIREAAINDIFQMLAKRAGKQYFHNPKAAGPEFNVRGHLNGGDPLQQMEELAFMHGLSLHQKGDTVYALNEEQMNQLPAEELHYPLQSIRPDDFEQVKELIQPMLSPTGIANYEPKTNTITIIDSPHTVDRARSLLAAVDKPKGQAAAEKHEENSQLGGDDGRQGLSSPAEALTLEAGPGPQETDKVASAGKLSPGVSSLGEQRDETSPENVDIRFEPQGTDQVASAKRHSIASTQLGKHSDGASWGNVDIKGSVYASKAQAEGGPALDRLASRKGITLSDASTIGGVTGNLYGGGQPSREDYEAANADFFPLSSGQSDSDLVAFLPVENGNQTGLEELQDEKSAETPERSTRRTYEYAGPGADEETTLDDDARRALAGGGQVAGEAQPQKRPVPIRRAPFVMRTINDTEVSNQVTEEVRYSIDKAESTPEELLNRDDHAETPADNERDGREVALLKNLGAQLRSAEEAAQIVNSRHAPNSPGGKEASGIEVKKWTLPLHAWKKIQEGQVAPDGKLNANDLLADRGESIFVTDPRQALGGYGITFPDGARAHYTAATGTFVARNTAKNLDLIDSLVQGSLQQVERERGALKAFETIAGDEPYSTFSLNVSDVSFRMAKAFLARGDWPVADLIRVEEFVNAFDYGDPAPSQKEKVACKLEQAAHPFLQQRNLLRVSMRTAALGRSADTPLRLTVLLDRSGSMERADREDSVKRAFQLLANQLNPQDQITLISFARTPRLLADRLTGKRVAELVTLVESAPSEGGTNLEQALELGIAKAKEQMLEGMQNRIILLTDGAANLGNAQPEDLARLVENMRQQGIAFDACGVGADGLNDTILESLTRKGDGRYYFLDRPEDADEGFAKQIAGALRPAARNVKVQVNFNPNRVERYKLYGFEKHRLKKEDFRNDSVDAAELAAEEAGNAIYQVKVLPEGSGEIGTVSVRFQDTESGRMIEREWTIPYEAQVPRLEDAAASLRLASGAALLGEKLKGSLLGEFIEMARLGKLINSLTGEFSSDERVKELVQMANRARELKGE